MEVRAAAEMESLTPMMRQYYELKEKAHDAILFFRMGDFYEIFGTDAIEVAPRLELVLTSRERGDNNRIPFCGVPHHSAKNYWLKLLKYGYKVALADQMEDPETAKGLVKREIVRILTPGCVDDLEALDADSPNYLLAAFEEPKSRAWAVALADISTGELRCGRVDSLEDLTGLVEVVRPREVLCRRFILDSLKEAFSRLLLNEKVSCTPLSEGVLRDEKEQARILKEVLGAADLKNQPCGEIAGGTGIIAAMMDYLRSLQCPTSQFLKVLPLKDPETMELDDVAIRDLELFSTVRRQTSEGSLYHEINATLTPMGARLLRYNLARPFLKKEPIQARHEMATVLLKNPEIMKSIRELLHQLPDLERLTTRLVAGSAYPQELARVRLTLERGLRLAKLCDEGGLKKLALSREIKTNLLKGEKAFGLLSKALTDEPSPLGERLEVFVKGYDPVLDEKRELSRNGEARIADYEEEQRQKTGIGSLKIKNHKTYGLLMEVTKTHLAKVPKDYVRRQTMVNCERFVTPALEKLNEALTSATFEAVSREAELYQKLLQELAPFKSELKLVAQGLAHLDVLQSFAFKAHDKNYVAPRFAANGEVKLVGSRHPVVESFVGRHVFVPNDMVLNAKEKHLLITGPNMAGKSTVMRQMAICAILHQIGSFIPAVEATLPLFDRIFTRVGAADDLSRGQSTFMVEMSEAAQILRQASGKSLVILDEVGRGTSTQDGLAIAAAIFEELVKEVGAYCLFATHYHELVPFAASLPGVLVAQTEVTEKDSRVVFTHRLVAGASGSSFGLEVAKLAGIPTRVLKKAAMHLEDYQAAPPPAAPRKKRPAKDILPLEEFGLQTQENGPHEELARRVREVDILATTPLEAMNILSDLKALCEKGVH